MQKQQFYGIDFCPNIESVGFANLFSHSAFSTTKDKQFRMRCKNT